LLNKTEKCFLC